MTPAWPFSELANPELQIVRQQCALAKFGELALGSNDLDKILSVACGLVAEALRTDLVAVVELQQDSKTLKVRAGVGWRSGIVGVQTIAVADNTPEGVAVKRRGPTVFADIGTDTRVNRPGFIIEHGVRAVANVTIDCSGGGEPAFGVLEVASRSPREFTKQDLAFLSCYGHLLEAAVIRLRAAEVLEAKTRDLTEMNARLRRATGERVRVEEALHQSWKMAAVGQLTGGLSHDFNNILTTISGNLELLGRRVAQGRMAELDRYIIASMSAVDRAVALTHRLLAFSRRQTLDPGVVDLNQIIRGMEDLICRTVGPSIQIELRLEDDLWLTSCDSNQVESALLNLAINARDAMPLGGQLRFETANIVFPGGAGTTDKILGINLPSSDYVDLSVTDTGHGMSSSVLESAFVPFFTTKPAGQGTGLGLSIIDSFVRQSGGKVQLQSEAGQGTTVTVHFPRCLEDIRGGDCPIAT